MDMPFLLLMPSYNQAHYIVDAVRSVLAQDDPNWELWIVDNSSDSTPQVMQQFTDPRIHFHHIAERMDPGSCLNWMLERAAGREFSYIHTDNNLHISYVRLMRTALADHPLGLAYCDSRSINEAGRYTGLFFRGEFGLARLLSIDTLGVPFAATVELAKQLGGFSTRDFADDVRFCVSAFGLAQYVYVREPLVDYRLHDGSRTEEAGGHRQIQRIFVDLMPKILPTLEQRGLRPLQVMEHAIREGLDEFEFSVEDYWHRKLSKISPAWWQGRPRLDHFFWYGLLNMPGFDLKLGRPPRRLLIHNAELNVTVMPWSIFLIRRYLHKYRKHLRQLIQKPRNMLLTWACMKLGVTSSDKVFIRICSLDTRTIWAARELEQSLGWRPLLDAGISTPNWLSWDKAVGTEPLLDCSTEVNLTLSSSQQ